MGRPHPLLVELAADRGPQRHRIHDGEALVASALEHRMHGLLWSSVASGAIPVDRSVAQTLAREDLATRAHHRRLWATLADVQRRLSAISIDIATAKGITAEARWYGREGERPCNDLDVLLDPGAAGRVGDAIEVLQPHHIMRSRADTLARSGVLQSLDLSIGGVEVDLHADLLKLEVPTRGAHILWARTTTVAAPSGDIVRALDAETSLIHFLVHLHKDRFSRLLGYADVARILTRESLDWAFIDDFVAREGLRVHVYSALWRVTTALGLAPPPVDIPSSWRATAWARLWPDDEQLRGYPGFAARLGRRAFWIPWLAEGRVHEAMRWWLRRRIFPPRPLLDLYHPDTKGPYLIRLVVGRWRRAQERRAASDRAR